ncbi:hypothetical protein [Kitasatospora sp. NPDC018619]|uniref:hypothetical protein n=1 Tax=unclassified Kitasatospora TaxID=2633591 RepID=UPI0037AF53F8
MVTSTADRHRDSGVLRPAGTVRRQTTAVAAPEAVLVVTAAALPALAATAPTRYGTTALPDHRVPAGQATVALRLPRAPLGAGTARCLLLAVASSVLPDRVALTAPAR